MGSRPSITLASLFLAATTLLGACATTDPATEGNAETAAQSTIAEADLNWFAKRLQEEGVFVDEQGPADLDFPAEASRRYVLNRRDVVEAFVFADEAVASSKAYELAGANPLTEVYRRESLVVVRYEGDDTVLRLTLLSLLGRTL